MFVCSGAVNADVYCNSTTVNCPVGLHITGTQCPVGCDNSLGFCRTIMGSANDGTCQTWSGDVARLFTGGLDYACGFRVFLSSDSTTGYCGSCNSSCVFQSSVDINPGFNDYFWDCCPVSSTNPIGSYCPFPPRQILSSLNCSAYGLYGRGYPNGDWGYLGWQDYTCGPVTVSSLDERGDQIGCWYTGVWDGYFWPSLAQGEGWYQFFARVSAAGTFGIDLNGDGVINCWNRGWSVDANGNPIPAPEFERLGNQWYKFGERSDGVEWSGYFWTQSDRENRASVLSMPLDEIVAPLPANTNIIDYQAIPPWYSETSRWWTNLSGQNGECIYTHRNNNVGFNDGFKTSESRQEFDSAHIWARMYLYNRPYKVRFTYDRNYGSSANFQRRGVMDFYYKGPGQQSFILASTLNGSPSCPFRPCGVPPCSISQPQAPVLELPAGDARVVGANQVYFTWSYNDSGWGNRCDSTATQRFEVCVANTQEYAANFSNCVYGGEVSSSARRYPASGSLALDNLSGGRQYWWNVRAINDVPSSTSNSRAATPRTFFMPSNATIVLRQSLTNDSTAPEVSLSSWTIGVNGNNSEVFPPGSTGFYGSFNQNQASSVTRYFLPSRTQTTFRLSSLPVGWRVTYPFTGVRSSNMQSNESNIYFNVERMADPWFQVERGDVYAATQLSAIIPTNQFFLVPNDTSSGVAIQGGQFSDILGGLHQSRPWLVLNSSATMTGSWLNYVALNFGQTISTIAPSLTVSNQESFNNLNWTIHIEEPTSKVVRIDGDLTISGNLTIGSGDKYTLLVDGQVTIDTNSITVSPGGFLAIVAAGDITFGSNTRTIAGVYVSDSHLIVSNTSSDEGLSRQFVGNGTFVGMRGVVLHRNLNGDSSTVYDDLANNSNPAVKFVYRPDFLMNAPKGFLRSSITWKEVAPGGE